MKHITLSSFHALFAALGKKGIMLTANNRLARTLSRQYDDWQAQNSQKAWPSLSVLPFRTWLVNAFAEHENKGETPAYLLLNTHQEDFLWQSVIQADSEENNFKNRLALIESVKQAWSLIHHFHISLNDLLFDYFTEGRTFKHWAQTFLKKCHEQAFMDSARLLSFIQEKLSFLTLPAEIYLIGFLEFSPAEKNFFEALEKAGVLITRLTLEISAKSIHAVSAIDSETEIKLMAGWAKEMMQKDEAAIIECIVPHLTQAQKTIARIFHETFVPPHEFPDASTLPYNIAAGTALSKEPIIAITLSLLPLLFKPYFSVESLGLILRSPFLYTTENTGKLQKALNEAEQQYYTFEDLFTHFPTEEHPFLSLIKEAKALLPKTQKQSMKAWVSLFAKILHQLQWPAAHVCQSREYQALEHFQTLLKTLTTLDKLKNSYTALEAISLIQKSANQTLFQPKSNPFARVQILGLLEATGSLATHRFICGLDDEHWPAIAHPNPFIPYPLQTGKNMPHANSERERQFSEQWINTMLNTAENILLSYAKQSAGEAQRPSEQIANFSALPEAEIQKYMPQATTAVTETIFENIKDAYGPSFNSEKIAPGGTQIFRLMAACPFCAFAKLRLQAELPDEPHMGFSRKTRGILLHQILETLGKRIPSQEKLLSLSAATLTEYITQAVHYALKKQTRTSLLPKRFLKQEKMRFIETLQKWFALEKTRKRFKILEQERFRFVSIGPLRIKIRIDRIDQIEENKYIVMDYKSGHPTISDWFSDRPDDLQLPLYAVTSEKPIVSLAFAELNAETVSFKAVSHTKETLPNDTTLKEITWEKQLSLWKETLEQFATDFYEGKAILDPKKERTTCERCGLMPLCRIYQND